MIKKLAVWVQYIVCGAAGLWLLWLLLQVTVFATFRIPSDSMMPALEAGDRIVVSKLTAGARIFNVWEAVEGKQVPIYRLPGFGRIERNDVVVFNHPYAHSWKRIRLDVMAYYVKRCVALPGDTFEIKDGHYTVRGYTGALGNREAQEELRGILHTERHLKEMGIVMRAFPNDSLINWSIQDFGPLYLPKKGERIGMDERNTLLYRQLIEWEQRKPLAWKAGKVYLGDSLITGYRFRENYYFVCGDRVMNSRDSRYWGPLPESFIVGKAAWIWKSVDPYTGRINWKRCLKRIE